MYSTFAGAPARSTTCLMTTLERWKKSRVVRRLLMLHVPPDMAEARWPEQARNYSTATARVKNVSGAQTISPRWGHWAILRATDGRSGCGPWHLESS
jgi:hypothetical protein